MDQRLAETSSKNASPVSTCQMNDGQMAGGYTPPQSCSNQWAMCGLTARSLSIQLPVLTLQGTAPAARSRGQLNQRDQFEFVLLMSFPFENAMDSGSAPELRDAALLIT